MKWPIIYIIEEQKSFIIFSSKLYFYGSNSCSVMNTAVACLENCRTSSPQLYRSDDGFISYRSSDNHVSSTSCRFLPSFFLPLPPFILPPSSSYSLPSSRFLPPFYLPLQVPLFLPTAPPSILPHSSNSSLPSSSLFHLLSSFLQLSSAILPHSSSSFLPSSRFLRLFLLPLPVPIFHSPAYSFYSYFLSQLRSSFLPLPPSILPHSSSSCRPSVCFLPSFFLPLPATLFLPPAFSLHSTSLFQFLSFFSPLPPSFFYLTLLVPFFLPPASSLHSFSLFQVLSSPSSQFIPPFYLILLIPLFLHPASSPHSSSLFQFLSSFIPLVPPILPPSSSSFLPSCRSPLHSTSLI
jgi:hypothetical protein